MLSQNSRNFSRFYNTIVSCSRVVFKQGKVSTVVPGAEYMKMASFGQRVAGSESLCQTFCHYQLAKENQLTDFIMPNVLRATYISCIGKPLEVDTIFKIVEQLLCLHKHH